jgi:hypothetical protein
VIWQGSRPEPVSDDWERFDGRVAQEGICHYIIDTVMPRHFVESAEHVGVPGSVAREQLEELADLAPRAIEGVTKSLPRKFPRDISSSIVRGVEQRLTLACAAQTPTMR